MKIIKYLFLSLLLAIFALSCNKGLDPINPIAPGVDQTAPELTISYPEDSSLVKSTDSVATVYFKFAASDDIELKSVVVKLDGTEIGNITSFTDYRRFNSSFKYVGLRDGEHTLVVTATDLTDKTVSQSVSFLKITTEVYVPLAGEVLYLPFDGDYKDAISGNEISVVGTPSFVNEGKINLAYAGATDSYLTYPTDGLLGTTFSVAFWYKLNATPQRGGILSISRPYEVYNDSTRYKGFRMLRENNGTTKQNLGINFGIGAAEVWMNPFKTIDTTSVWMHIAVSISETTATIYLNGEVVMEKTDLLTPIDWSGCTSISIASGQPNFAYWDHLSDLSLYDEFHMFNRAITAEEIQAFYAAKK